MKNRLKSFYTTNEKNKIMIPSFPFIRVPEVLKRILKKNLRDSMYDEIFIAQELGKDPALKLLLQKYFKDKVPDQTLQGLYRYHGWDYLRKLICSLYIYRIAYNAWPTSETAPYIDGPFNYLEEELSDFSIQGSYRTSLLAFYLRVLELKLYQEHKVTSFNLIESCSKTVTPFSVFNIKGVEVDIAALQIWHLGEYYSWDILIKKIERKTNYEDIMSDLSVAYKKTITANISTYLLSISDEENFGLEIKV